MCVEKKTKEYAGAIIGYRSGMCGCALCAPPQFFRNAALLFPFLLNVVFRVSNQDFVGSVILPIGCPTRKITRNFSHTV